MKIFSSFHEISQALKNRETTCYQLVKDYLNVIEKKNKRINAFIEVYAEESLKNAKIIDKKKVMELSNTLSSLNFKNKIDYIVVEDLPLKVQSNKKNWHENLVTTHFKKMSKDK